MCCRVLRWSEKFQFWFLTLSSKLQTLSGFTRKACSGSKLEICDTIGGFIFYFLNLVMFCPSTAVAGDMTTIFDNTLSSFVFTSIESGAIPTPNKKD